MLLAGRPGSARRCSSVAYDPIDADVLFGWRLLGERRLSAQGECSTGGDALATVATFTAFSAPYHGCGWLAPKKPPVGPSLNSGASARRPRSRGTDRHVVRLNRDSTRGVGNDVNIKAVTAVQMLGRSLIGRLQQALLP
jgi:hypothetical protein